MTMKEKATAYRKMAADRAKLAAKYASTKNYEQAAKWYFAASNYTRIADELSSPKPQHC